MHGELIVEEREPMRVDQQMMESCKKMMQGMTQPGGANKPEAKPAPDKAK